ncbi:hypothetical protein GCM10022403_007650 [Streptomyces coacervatus]|uniref:Uncharacterized protein n=1 Tax=Streptomyces coacervatus TaxID=647381 RepID=A0ABP7GUW1_9ACTN
MNKPPPALRRPARTLAALPKRPRGSATRALRRLAIARSPTLEPTRAGDPHAAAAPALRADDGGLFTGSNPTALIEPGPGDPGTGSRPREKTACSPTPCAASSSRSPS